MIRAVCGFLFDSEMTKVVLIRKNRPDWQKGLFNGVGGKVEEGEFAEDAMVREFEEETGMRVDDWHAFCVHLDKANGFEVTYYMSVGDVTGAKTVTDEEIEIHDVGGVWILDVIPNLKWVIPMALDPDLTQARTVWDNV